VTPSELREVFNRRGYWERARRNELVAVVESDRPARPEANEPPGTRSQMVWHLDESRQRVALVHQYLRPDGTLGGAGRPDPKRLLLDDEILFC
jgi:hypothetical protein